MKKWMPLLVLILLLNACKEKETSEPMLLVGKWQLSAMQESNGKWRDIPSGQGLILEILADGSINYTSADGRKVPDCCSPFPHKTKGNKTILLTLTGKDCSFVLCSARSPSDPPVSFSWSVTYADSQMLEVKTGYGQQPVYQLQKRYQQGFRYPQRIRYKKIG